VTVDFNDPSLVEDPFGFLHGSELDHATRVG